MIKNIFYFLYTFSIFFCNIFIKIIFYISAKITDLLSYYIYLIINLQAFDLASLFPLIITLF